MIIKNPSRKPKRGNALTSIGATFDPAIILNPRDYLTRTNWGGGWAEELSDVYLRLLICDVAEIVALPIYESERPDAQFFLNAMKDAICVGRGMAEGQTLGNIPALRDDLRNYVNREEDRAEQQPGGISQSGAAMACLEIAYRCLWPSTFSVGIVFDHVYAAIERQYRGSRQPLLPDDEMRRYIYEQAAPVAELCRQAIQLNFQEAEQEAHEGGYPLLTGAYQPRSENHSIVVATLMRHKMIQLMQDVWRMSPSEVVAHKLNLADAAMRSIDSAPLYLNMASETIRFWSRDENKLMMQAWQTLLRYRNDAPGSVRDELRGLPTTPRKT